MRLAIRLFCNDCKRCVSIDRDFFLEILLKWRDNNPDSDEEEIKIFRCDDCALSLIRRVPDIHLVRSFRPYIVEYWSNDDIHLLAVYQEGQTIRYSPHVSFDLPVIYETYGRRFVGQAYTDRLPRIFEVKFADDEPMQTRTQ